MTLFQYAMTLLHMNDKLFNDVFPFTFKKSLILNKDKGIKVKKTCETNESFMKFSWSWTL
mgnify:CR=1 FL=1